MSVKWIPIVLICSTGTPKNECVENSPNVTKLTAEPQISPSACLMAAMGRYAAYENSPELNEPLEPRFICKEKHYDD